MSFKVMVRPDGPHNSMANRTDLTHRAFPGISVSCAASSLSYPIEEFVRLWR